jgi:hypothetical protein
VSQLPVEHTKSSIRVAVDGGAFWALAAPIAAAKATDASPVLPIITPSPTFARSQCATL